MGRNGSEQQPSSGLTLNLQQIGNSKVDM